jgi:hypothetical protein
MIAIDYTAPPTVARMMLSDAFIRVIVGPVGSGKTTGLIFELLRRSCEQWPSPDGIRYTRWAICRQTLSQLKNTVLKDIAYWFSGIAHWKVSDSTIYIEFGDVKTEWLLLPMETPEDQRRLLSMNLTGIWVSEAIEIDYDLIGPISARCGRYPGPGAGGCRWAGIVCDTNQGTEGTPWGRALTRPPIDMQVWVQPSGLSAEAENLAYLLQTPETLKLPVDHPTRLAQGRLYYERLARNQNAAWVTRYVHARLGPDPSGTAVFASTFRHSFHVVRGLEPVRGMPLVVGNDFGRDPWGAVTQLDNAGRLLVLEEIAAHDTGLTNHCRTTLRPRLMAPRYAGLPIVIVGDPAGDQRSQYDEMTAFDVLANERFTAVPAGTNDIDTRLSAVDYWLLQQRMGGPAIVFDEERCPTLIEGMAGMYRYAKTTLDVSKPKPDKNPWSHVCDALQYACLGQQSGTARAIARLLRGTSRSSNGRVSAAGWT